MTFSPMQVLKKGFSKPTRSSNKGLLISKNFSPRKGNPGVFFDSWNQQTQWQKRQNKTKNTPIVIPVNQTAARFLSNEDDKNVHSTFPSSLGEQKRPRTLEEEQTVTPLLRKQKAISQKRDRKSQEILTAEADQKNVVKQFTVPLIDENRSTSVNSEIPTEKPMISAHQKELILEKIIQNSLNSSLFGKNKWVKNGTILKIDFVLDQAHHSKQDLKSSKDILTSIFPKPEGKLKFSVTKIFQKSDLIWQPLNDEQQIKQILKQLHLQKIPELQMKAIPLKDDLYQVEIRGLQTDVKALKTGVSEQLPTGKEHQPQVTSEMNSNDNAFLNKKLNFNGNNTIQSKTASLTDKTVEHSFQIQINVETNETPASSNSVLKAGIEMANANLTSGSNNGPKAFSRMLKIQLLQMPVSQTGLTNVHHFTALNHGLAASRLESFIVHIKEMVEQAQTLKSGHGQIRMSFEETPMGKLDLQFRQSDGQLTIVVESEHIKNELLRLRPIIQQNLSEKGIVLNNFNVTVNQYLQSDQKNAAAKNKLTPKSSFHSRKEVGEHEMQTTVKQSRNFGYNTMEITI